MDDATIKDAQIKSEKQLRKAIRDGAEMMTDPWAHRSAGMQCLTCMYYVPKAGTANLGRCRRHAPRMGGYPVVFPHDWCGDHKLNEEIPL